MQGLLGFDLDFWDYVTFVSLFIVGAGFMTMLVLVAGLPGRIAVARKHPDAEAVTIMGWAGLLPVLPWIQAFIWAFRPTDIVDIRRYPKEEARAVDEEIAHLKGVAPPSAPKELPKATPGARPPADTGEPA